MHHQRGARLKCERRASLAPLIESHTTHDTTLSTFVARTHALAHPDVHTAHHALPTRRRATGAPSRFHWTGKAQFAPHTCRPRPPPRHHLARIVSAHACHDAARRFRRRKPQLGDCAGLARWCRPSTRESGSRSNREAGGGRIVGRMPQSTQLRQRESGAALRGADARGRCTRARRARRPFRAPPCRHAR